MTQKSTKAYWDKKIKNYLSQEWSQKPSPFAVFVANHVKPKSKILELGAGAGQDGLYFASLGHDVLITDVDSIAFKDINNRAKTMGLKSVKFKTIDLTDNFNLSNTKFDLVYAQLVLHYFNDTDMQKIITQIHTALKTGGMFACMVNSTSDQEYSQIKNKSNELSLVNGIQKRFFTTNSFSKFTNKFTVILLDNKGTTPKDDIVGTSNIIRFIGIK